MDAWNPVCPKCRNVLGLAYTDPQRRAPDTHPAGGVVLCRRCRALIEIGPDTYWQPEYDNTKEPLTRIATMDGRQLR